MAKSMQDRLIGAWELIDCYAYLPNDESDRKFPMGPEAQGRLLYLPNGYMSTQVFTPGQNKFDMPGSVEDWAQVGRRYIAYSGTFEFNESADGDGPFVLHNVHVASWPLFQNETQKRLVKFVDREDGEYLELSLKTQDVLQEGRWTMNRWKRLADYHNAPHPFEANNT